MPSCGPFRPRGSPDEVEEDLPGAVAAASARDGACLEPAVSLGPNAAPALGVLWVGFDQARQWSVASGQSGV